MEDRKPPPDGLTEADLEYAKEGLNKHPEHRFPQTEGEQAKKQSVSPEGKD